ncbi:MAG: WhiB family transcriptional regulator [Nitriliruptoraceae bacterium]
MLEQLLAAPDKTADDEYAWRNAAACLTEDPELFFPEGESERYALQIEAALSVCATCEVAEPCLRYALETEQRTGIWGGTTATVRRELEVVGAGVSAAGRGLTAAAAAVTGQLVAAGADEPDARLRRAAG